MLGPANYYLFYQELCFFVYRPIRKLHSAPLRTPQFLQFLLKFKKLENAPSKVKNEIFMIFQFLVT